MSTKENQYFLKKEIQISSEQIPKEENPNQNKYIKEIKVEDPKENENLKENQNEIILNKDIEYEELNNLEDKNYCDEIYTVESKSKKSLIKRKQQTIYSKIRTESSRNQKNKISNYIYKSGKAFPGKNNKAGNANNCIMNTAKYLIKNPIKEKSKNKLKKTKINETDINTNFNIKTNEISNLDDYGNNKNINNSNYIYNRSNELDNNNDNDNDEINIIITNPKKQKNNKINLQNPSKKKDIMSFNSFNKLQDAKFKYIPNTTKGEGRITYICDYSQENNKDSYYIESPTDYNRHISIYPIQPKLKKRKIKEKKYNKGDKLKKEIEDSKKKFEKIREIEREIKNYFNLNGLDIVNRELYDQSATMIQATFRAYLLRLQLYEKLNLYIDIKNAIDIIKNLFLTRKINYWENFISAILEYITILNTNIDNNIENEDENEVNLNSEKYEYLNDEFNEVDNSKIKYIKKIPTSFKQKPKNKIITNNSLIEQSCISFYFNNNINNKEELINQIMKENEELKRKNEELKNNNVIKDTQKSVELKLDEETKEINLDNQKIKMDKLNFVLKLLDLKYKENLYKYFMQLYNNAILLKYISNLKETKKEERNKIIKRLVLNKDKNLRNIKDKIFHIFYFKGLINNINEKKEENQNNTQENQKEKEKEKLDEEIKDE